MKKLAVILFIVFVVALAWRATCSAGELHEYRVMVTSPWQHTWFMVTLDYDSTETMMVHPGRSYPDTAIGTPSYGSDVSATAFITVNDTHGSAGFPVWTSYMNRHVVMLGLGEFGPGCGLHVLTFHMDQEAELAAFLFDGFNPPGNPPNQLGGSNDNGLYMWRPNELYLCDYYPWETTECADTPCDLDDPWPRIWIVEATANVLPVRRNAWSVIKGLYR